MSWVFAVPALDGRADVTEGGEALAMIAAVATLANEVPVWTLGADQERPSPWHVLWTRSHCESMVFDQLVARGFHPFLPTLEIWSRRRGLRHLITAPMFPGYLFLNDTLDKQRYVDVRKARGLVSILGEGWDRPAVVPDHEVEAIRTVVDAHVPALTHPYLAEGQRVRIAGGPFQGVEGILVQSRPRRGLLVLSVGLLQRSVAVEIDCTQVIPA